MNSKKKYFIVCLSIIFIVLTIYTCYKLIPLLIALKEPASQERFKNYIENLGWMGWLTVLTIQVLQIFIAFIPGEIVELLAGILYGPVGGLLICLLGILIGSILIYYTMKLFANKHIMKYKEKLKTYNFLSNPKKIPVYFFILFLIPGLPKDIFIYLVPFLPIKFYSFLIVSLIARIPSILSSTVVGSSLVEGNYLTSIIIFSIFLILGLLGILFQDRLFSLFKRKNKEIDTNKLEN